MDVIVEVLLDFAREVEGGFERMLRGWRLGGGSYNGAVPRFKLTIEYAGTRYSGWQIQKNARTVQGEIDRAVRTVTQRKDFEL